MFCVKRKGKKYILFFSCIGNAINKVVLIWKK